MLGYWDNGIRHMTNSKRPITRSTDMKGLKMRTPPDTMLVDIMQALGAEAQQIKFAELYVALQQGVVDGQENPLANIHASKLYEVQKYLALTGHQFQIDAVPDEQALVGPAVRRPTRRRCTEAAAEATALQRKLSQEADDKLLADLKAQGRAGRRPSTRRLLRRPPRRWYDKWLAAPIGPYVKRSSPPPTPTERAQPTIDTRAPAIRRSSRRQPMNWIERAVGARRAARCSGSARP